MPTRREFACRVARPLLGRLALLTAALAAASVLIPAAMANPRDKQGAYQQWEQMPAEQRERILQEQQRFKRLPPSEQERLRHEYEQRRRQ